MQKRVRLTWAFNSRPLCHINYTHALLFQNPLPLHLNPLTILPHLDCLMPQLQSVPQSFKMRSIWCINLCVYLVNDMLPVSLSGNCFSVCFCCCCCYCCWSPVFGQRICNQACANVVQTLVCQCVYWCVCVWVCWRFLGNCRQHNYVVCGWR